MSPAKIALSIDLTKSKGAIPVTQQPSYLKDGVKICSIFLQGSEDTFPFGIRVYLTETQAQSLRENLSQLFARKK